MRGRCSRIAAVCTDGSQRSGAEVCGGHHSSDIWLTRTPLCLTAASSTTTQGCSPAREPVSLLRVTPSPLSCGDKHDSIPALPPHPAPPASRGTTAPTDGREPPPRCSRQAGPAPPDWLSVMSSRAHTGTARRPPGGRAPFPSPPAMWPIAARSGARALKLRGSPPSPWDWQERGPIGRRHPPPGSRPFRAAAAGAGEAARLAALGANGLQAKRAGRERRWRRGEGGGEGRGAH